MQYKIISPRVGARHCRALTSVLDSTDNRYKETQERREYWENKNRQRLGEIAHIPPKPGQEAIHAKLQAWKAKLGLRA